MKKTKPKAGCARLPVCSRVRMRRAGWNAMMRAYARKATKTRKGKAIIASERMAHLITEKRALGDHGTMEGNNFVGLHRQLIIDGNGDGESVSLLYGWMGDVLTAMVLRYKRGNKSMRLGVQVMRLGRKALRGAYRRWKKMQRAGFNGQELQDFEVAFDLGIQFTPSMSKSELREVFKLSDERHKKFEKRTNITKAVC